MISERVAYCGLVCGLCDPCGNCSCKSSNHCGKQQIGCYQFNCCTAKGIDGCWECGDAPCGIDMLAPNKIKLRAFIRYIKEVGLEEFYQILGKNQQNGILYHRSGILGDYDLESEEAVLKLLRQSNKA